MTYRNAHHLRIENRDFAEGNTIRYLPMPAFDHAAVTRLQKHVEAAARRPGIARDLPRFIAPASTVFPADDARSRNTTSAHYLAATARSVPRFFRETSWSSPNPATRPCNFNHICLLPELVALHTPPVPDRLRKLSRSRK